MALPFIVVVAGLVAYRLASTAGSGFQLVPHPRTGEPWDDTALPLLIARYYAVGLVGLGITALLAGFMAGQAGNVSASNGVWTCDIYRVGLKKDAADAHLIWAGRLTTIVGMLLSVGTAYVAMKFNSIMRRIQAILSWVDAPLFATMLLGMFWRRTMAAGAFWGLVAGMVTCFSTFLGFQFDPLSPAATRLITLAASRSDKTRNVWRAAWARVVCLVPTVALSLVTRPRPESELVGLVKGLTAGGGKEAVGRLRRPAFRAACSVAVLVAFNVYFW